MASSNSHNSKPRKPLPKPRMLKDYLLDDLRSCSSSGFRSYPRRQCCTTVRFLLEIDLKSRDSDQRRSLRRSISTNTSATKSAFRRASEAVINAVKLLPFAAAKSPNSSKQSEAKKSILQRSLSRKLLKRSFWKSIQYFVKENEKPMVFSPSPATTTTITTTVTTATGSNCSSSKNNSCSDSDFNLDYLQFSSGNLESLCDNDVVEDDKRCSPEKAAVSRRLGVTNGDYSIEVDATTANHSKNKWPSEEKEQFSPVSVLDLPFHDEDEDEVSSPFQRRLAHMEGTKTKLMQKIRQFENLSQLEPVDLENQFSLSESTDESPESPSLSAYCLDSIQDNDIACDKEENDIESTAVDMLHELMKSTSSFAFKAENLLLDFIREKSTDDEFDHKLLNVAKDWMNGCPQELFLEWEVQENRQAYVRDMEMGGEWSKLDQEREEVAMELEVELSDSLLNELLLDLF